MIRAFDETLRSAIAGNLERFDRHPHPSQDLVPAAVVVALIGDEDGRACFLLTRRAAGMRAHRGQWALPGGRLDAGETRVAAALRELDEELNVRLDEDSVLGLLDDYVTRSGYVITPVVVWCDDGAEPCANPHEVAAVYRVAVAELDHPGTPHVRAIPESDRPVISLPLLDTHIHAPTAAVLYQFREVGIHGRPTRVAHFEQPVFAWH